MLAKMLAEHIMLAAAAAVAIRVLEPITEALAAMVVVALVATMLHPTLWPGQPIPAAAAVARLIMERALARKVAPALS